MMKFLHATKPFSLNGMLVEANKPIPLIGNLTAESSTDVLSPQERIFYERLAERPERPVLVADLLNAADSDGFNDCAKVVVHRIRRKLGVDIVSHRARFKLGLGSAYSLKEKTDEQN